LKLTSVNGSERLWSISDIWPRELVDQVLAIDWLREPVTKSPSDMMYRDHVRPQHQCIKAVEEYMHNHIPKINQITNSNFTTCAGVWNLCQPGYISYIHHDGELANTMLIYWNAPDSSYGTTFYNSNSTDDVFHQFESVAGTGYLMLNHADSTGHRPLQYHGMQKPVPANAWRLITLWNFYS
jgi:hypothetical protein